VKRTCQDGHSTRLPVLVSSLYMEDVREMKTNFGVRQNVRRYVMPLLEKGVHVHHMKGSYTDLVSQCPVISVTAVNAWNRTVNVGLFSVPRWGVSTEERMTLRSDTKKMNVFWLHKKNLKNNNMLQGVHKYMFLLNYIFCYDPSKNT